MAMVLIPSGSTASLTRPPLLVGSGKQTPRTECSECLNFPLWHLPVSSQIFTWCLHIFPPDHKAQMFGLTFSVKVSEHAKWPERDTHLMQPYNSEEVLQLDDLMLSRFKKNVNVALVPRLLSICDNWVGDFLHKHRALWLKTTGTYEKC